MASAEKRNDHYIMLFHWGNHQLYPGNGLLHNTCIILPAQVDKNARWISLSKSLRGTLFKPRRHQLLLLLRFILIQVLFCT